MPRPGDSGQLSLRRISKTAGAPIQTVFIETNSRFLGKGWPLLRMPAFPLVYRARLGQRFEVNGDVKTFVSDVEDYFRRTLTPGNMAAGVVA